MLHSDATKTVELRLHADGVLDRVGDPEVTVDALGSQGFGKRHGKRDHRAGPDLVDRRCRDTAPEIAPQETLDPLLAQIIERRDGAFDRATCLGACHLPVVEGIQQVHEDAQHRVIVTVGTKEVQLVILDHAPVLPWVSSHDKGPSQGLIVTMLTEECLLEEPRVVGLKLF